MEWTTTFHRWLIYTGVAINSAHSYKVDGVVWCRPNSPYTDWSWRVGGCMRVMRGLVTTSLSHKAGRRGAVCRSRRSSVYPASNCPNSSRGKKHHRVTVIKGSTGALAETVGWSLSGKSNLDWIKLFVSKTFTHHRSRAHWKWNGDSSPQPSGAAFGKKMEETSTAMGLDLKDRDPTRLNDSIKVTTLFSSPPPSAVVHVCHFFYKDYCMFITLGGRGGRGGSFPHTGNFLVMGVPNYRCI